MHAWVLSTLVCYMCAGAHIHLNLNFDPFYPIRSNQDFDAFWCHTVRLTLARVVPSQAHVPIKMIKSPDQVCFRGFSWLILVLSQKKICPELGTGPCMEHALDIEELRTQMASERLAREQADDRCMDNIRDMINEERILLRHSAKRQYDHISQLCHGLWHLILCQTLTRGSKLKA